MFQYKFDFSTSKSGLDIYYDRVLYELPHKMPNKLRLTILGNQEVWKMSKLGGDTT